MENRTGDYNVEEFNAETEAESVGRLGKALILLPGIAESVLKDCDEPDLAFKSIAKQETGEWEIDDSISFSIYYPGNSYQTSVAKVTKITTSGKQKIDYYQVPYSEIIPRVRGIMESRLGTDSRWFLTRCDNIQFDAWCKESGIHRMTANALSLLSEKKENESIRNQYNGGMEQREERTDG